MPSEQYKRVLVADDDHEIRRILVTALSQRGLIVDEAEDGARAIELLQENAYSVLVLDLLMPGVDGFEVLETLDEGTTPSPVVLVVSGAERSVIERVGARRIHGVVRKPFDIHDVASVIAACAEIRGKSAFETMALATMLSGAPLLALFNRF